MFYPLLLYLWGSNVIRLCSWIRIERGMVWLPASLPNGMRRLNSIAIHTFTTREVQTVSPEMVHEMIDIVQGRLGARKDIYV